MAAACVWSVELPDSGGTLEATITEQEVKYRLVRGRGGGRGAVVSEPATHNGADGRVADDLEWFPEAGDDEEDDEDDRIGDTGPNEVWDEELPQGTLGNVRWTGVSDETSEEALAAATHWLPHTRCATTWRITSNASDSALRDDMGRMLMNAMSTGDVLIQAGDGAPLYAHSFVLESRCEYFRARARVSNENRHRAGCTYMRAAPSHQDPEVIEVPDHSREVMRIVLEFIYTGRTTLSTDCAAELLPLVLHAGTFFMLPTMREACLQLASVKADKLIAAEWMAFARNHGEDELAAIARSYMRPSKRTKL